MTRQQTPPDNRSAAKILAALRRTAGKLAALEERQRQLYDERLALIQEARALDPPVLMHELADAAGVTEVAVTKILTRARERG